jgi:hypothetical protein
MLDDVRSAPAPSGRYLRVSGRLSPDRRLRLRPGYLVDVPDRDAPRRESRAIAEVLDDRGQVRLRHPLAIGHRCAQGDGSVTLRGAVPFPEDTARVRVLFDGVVVGEIVRSAHAPRVTLRRAPTGEARGRQTVAWEATHAEGRPLHFCLRYSHDGGRRWGRITLRTQRQEIELDLDALPGGADCRVAVVASDGVNTTVVESAPFSTPLKPCRAMVLGPADGARLSRGEPARLRGQGYWLEENRPETERLTWTSSRDGELGRGMALDVLLSPGEHEIQLVAGEGARAGTATVRVVVGPSPTKGTS